MNRFARKVLWGLTPLVLVAFTDIGPAAAQPFDHLTCLRVNRDLRDALSPPPLTLDAQQTEFLDSQGCKPTGGGRIARASRVCFPTNKAPSNPPGGIELSDQDFLCYRVKCEQNGGGLTEVQLTDQFGSGTVRVNQRPNTKELCVPAFKAGVPTPTPTGVATPTPTAVVTPTPTPTVVVPTPTPTPTATPTPTPPYGSASRAFMEKVTSLLN